MWKIAGVVILVASLLNCASSARLNDVWRIISIQSVRFLSKYNFKLKEYSVGTNLNKYLWGQKDGDGEIAKRDGEKRTTALWFGPRLGKRFVSQQANFI